MVRINFFSKLGSRGFYFYFRVGIDFKGVIFLLLSGICFFILDSFFGGE